MSKIMVPNLYTESFLTIDTGTLKNNGISGLIFDLDNTLIKWGSYVVTDELAHSMNSLKKDGFKLCIVSNNAGAKIEEFARILDIPLVQRAKKPSRRPFIRAMNLIGTKPSETAMVGDQIFTDIIGGNRSGVFTILVVPVSEKEFLGTRLVRIFERFIMNYLVRKGYLDK